MGNHSEECIAGSVKLLQQLRGHSKGVDKSRAEGS
jgi:hypothetical protein